MMAAARETQTAKADDRILQHARTFHLPSPRAPYPVAASADVVSTERSAAVRHAESGAHMVALLAGGGVVGCPMRTGSGSGVVGGSGWAGREADWLEDACTGSGGGAGKAGNLMSAGALAREVRRDMTAQGFVPSGPVVTSTITTRQVTTATTLSIIVYCHLYAYMYVTVWKCSMCVSPPPRGVSRGNSSVQTRVRLLHTAGDSFLRGRGAQYQPPRQQRSQQLWP